MGKAKAKKAANGSATNGAAKTKAGRGEPVERARYVRNLPVPADPKTIAKASTNFARLVSEEERLQEERREANAGFKSRKNAIDESMREWRDTVQKGTLLAAVECSELLVIETNEVQVKRLDTGEIVETRAASAEDRQETLGLDAMPSRDAKAVKRAEKELAARARPVPNDLWAARKDGPAHHFAKGVAKKGTAAARKKRGGKTTVVPASADA